MFERILVAFDGSSHARKALAIASDLAKAHGSALEIVHVVGRGPVPSELERFVESEHLVTSERRGPAIVGDVSSGLAAAQAARSAAHDFQVHAAIGERLVDQASATAREAGVKKVHGTVEDGDAAERLLARAREDGTDLMVMGTRGFSDLKGLLVGSVSHKVLQLAPCPCLIVK